MPLSKYIYSVIEKFYNLTNIPVQAYGVNGEKICHYGFSPKFNDIFKNENFLDKLDLEDININETITIKDSIHFSIMSICPKNQHRGVFIVGPYSSNPNISGIVYKPIELSSYMTKTIRMIWRDFSSYQQVIQVDEPYSFHVKKALDYIDSRYKEDLKLNDVAEYLNINKSYFCSILKKETGYTFTQYLNHVRIEKSKYLLLNKEHSMLDVALLVGFNNQNYYNIMFKKLTNLTPLEFKNSNVS